MRSAPMCSQTPAGRTPQPRNSTPLRPRYGVPAHHHLVPGHAAIHVLADERSLPMDRRTLRTEIANRSWVLGPPPGARAIRCPRCGRHPRQILARHGYLTIGFNTNPYLNSASNFHQGFAEYVEFEPDPEPSADIEYHALVGNYAPATVVIDTVLERLDNPMGRPVFLWIHLMDVHSPYLPPSALARAFPRRFTGRTDLDINEALYHEIYHQWGAEDAAASYPSYRDLGLTQDEFKEHLVGLYEAEVRYADYELGRLFRGFGTCRFGRRAW